MKQWDVNWGLYRRKIVFANEKKTLVAGIAELLENARLMAKNGAGAYSVELVENVAIDLQSCLTIWTLDKCVSKSEKDAAVAQLTAYLAEVGANDALRRIEEEAKSISESQFAKITKGTVKGELFTYWGNDLLTGIDYSLRRGASYTTSNPSKVNLFRQEEPEKYAEFLCEVLTTEPDLPPHDVISRITVKAVAQAARKLRPIYEATNGNFGVSFTQVSPFNWNDAAKMEEEVLRWHAAFAVELGVKDPNVVFKMPATPAAREAAQKLLKHEGIRLTLTSNFAVGQHQPFYDVLEGHQPNCFLVIVDTHMRKFAHPEFEAMGVNADVYCEKLVRAVVKRCYQTLLDRGSNIMLNGAGLREDIGVRLFLTDDARLPNTLTVTPSLVADFDQLPRSMKPIWNEPITDADMKILNESKTFRQSYYPEEFPWDDIESYAPYKFMMDGFVTAYNACMNALPISEE